MNRQERLLTGGGRGGGRHRTEGLSERGDRGQDAISLMPNVDGMHIPIFESSQLEDSYVGDLPYNLVHVADEETASEKSSALDNIGSDVLEPGFETRSGVKA